MLDMQLTDFRKLVMQGAIPGPIPIGDHPRWRRSDLVAIVDGSAIRPSDDDDFVI